MSHDFELKAALGNAGFMNPVHISRTLQGAVFHSSLTNLHTYTLLVQFKCNAHRLDL